jgi:hypothetical protein
MIDLHMCVHISSCAKSRAETPLIQWSRPITLYGALLLSTSMLIRWFWTNAHFAGDIQISGLWLDDE